MKTDSLLTVIGGGGHAKVVIATALELGYTIDRVLDADSNKVGSKIMGVEIVAQETVTADFDGQAVIAVGNNSTRKNIATYFSKARWTSLVHPGACVHESVKLGKGTVLFAGSIVQPDTTIGNHVVVNTGATIDHDCVVEDYVHVAPGVRLAGEVHVREGAFVGIGASVIQQKNIGEWSQVAGGSAVICDVNHHTLVAGVPAIIKKEGVNV